MDERYNESTNFESAPEAQVENNTPAPEAPAVVPEQPAKKKAPKDFTPEEVKAILARAAKVDLSRVAKEYNTSWQAIMSLQKAEAAAKAKAKQQKAKGAKKTIETPKTIKRSEEFTKKEKEDILERARKFGFREVAAEVGTNWQTLAYWNKQQKLTGSVPVDTKPASKSKAKTSVSSDKKTEKPKAVSTTATAASKSTKPANSEALEIENAILKEKLAILTQQVEKLRAAVGSLA